ncbi:type III pantothenate kinase [Thiomonas bhubaneswarensis]|uniref:Type III pantothenate kinase n=1 Tax=Thiomonas bhubaneswarensis TaxID=339866 RepID=A0A0K6I497_9BURK|nr:type III pantothenate kinase [Thiomonas bhubaneswarensis]CUA98092.1 pantothenate kinase, type III [Thiomonas bhubaneswarensis]
MHLLVLDVGNTRLKWGVYAQVELGAALLAGGAMALEDVDQLHQVLAAQPRPHKVIGCAVAGAVVTARVCAELDALGLRCNWISAQAEQCGVRNSYATPSLLGADRWAAQLGARQRVPDQAAMVISVGTAVTVDCLSREGVFIGGIILPGFGLMLKALEMGTAGLRVPEGGITDFPTNTSDALMTGGALAISGAARQMHARLLAREPAGVSVLLTGGAAPKLRDALGLPHQHVEHLVFEGLLCIAARQTRAHLKKTQGRPKFS